MFWHQLGFHDIINQRTWRIEVGSRQRKLPASGILSETLKRGRGFGLNELSAPFLDFLEQIEGDGGTQRRVFWVFPKETNFRLELTSNTCRVTDFLPFFPLFHVIIHFVDVRFSVEVVFGDWTAKFAWRENGKWRLAGNPSVNGRERVFVLRRVLIGCPQRREIPIF